MFFAELGPVWTWSVHETYSIHSEASILTCLQPLSLDFSVGRLTSELCPSVPIYHLLEVNALIIVLNSNRCKMAALA